MANSFNEEKMDSLIREKFLKMDSVKSKIIETVEEAMKKDPTLADFRLIFVGGRISDTALTNECDTIVFGIERNEISAEEYQYMIYMSISKYAFSMALLLEETLKEKFSSEGEGEVHVSTEVVAEDFITGTITKVK